MVEEAVDEGAVGVAGARMDDESRGLVDDDDRVVGVDDRELDRAVCRRPARARDRGRIDLHLDALGEPNLPRRGDVAVDPDPTGFDHSDGDGAADVGDEGHDAVETLPGERRRDPLDDHRSGESTRASAGCGPVSAF